MGIPLCDLLVLAYRPPPRYEILDKNLTLLSRISTLTRDIVY